MLHLTGERGERGQDGRHGAPGVQVSNSYHNFHIRPCVKITLFFAVGLLSFSFVNFDETDELNIIINLNFQITGLTRH